MGLFSSHLICSEAHRSRMCLILDQIYVYERVVVMTTLGQIKVRRVGLLHKVLLVVAEFLWDYLGYLLPIVGKSVRHQVWSVVIMVLVVVIVRFYCGQIFGFKRFLCRVVVDKLWSSWLLLCLILQIFLILTLTIVFMFWQLVHQIQVLIFVGTFELNFGKEFGWLIIVLLQFLDIFELDQACGFDWQLQLGLLILFLSLARFLNKHSLLKRV